MTRHPESSRKTPRSMLGMSLVEIMVATAVGLIGVTMIMQVYAVAEGQKRTTTGASDAQISGNIAMFSLERDLRLAGFGMVTNAGNMLGCNTFAHDSTRPANNDFTFEMAPVVITTVGNSDEIRVVHGNAMNIVEGSLFSSGATADVDFPLKNAAGFLVGTRVVAQETGKNCVLAEITGFVPAAVNTIQHAVGGAYTYTDTLGNPVNANARHNKAGGLGGPESYSASAKLYALGRNPVVTKYLVSAEKLVTQTDLPYVAAQDPDANGVSDAEIATGIVQLKAVYGKDTDGDGTVDLWDTVKPTTDVLWMQVRAVKVALLSRSALFEKTAVTGVAPRWLHPTAGPTSFTMANLADGTPWQNYRYRVYETTVPLRNLIWSNDP